MPKTKKRPTKSKAPSKTKRAAKAKRPPKAKAAAKKTPAPRPAPKIGSSAPTFALSADDGSEVSLASLKGRNVVLYFYPRDMTPGCTVEACAFRDAHAAIEKKGAVVLGVSRDSVATHAKFRDKEKLPFRLLSDPAGEVIASYGSFGEKSFMGRRFMGILRTTVLIDGKGKVRKVYPKVSPKTHVAEVLEDLSRPYELGSARMKRR
jgi:peroxiredoxin Q/BCP